MKKFIPFFLVISFSGHAFDFEGLVDKTKSKVNKLLGKEEKVVVVETIQMPTIPKVVKDARSMDVYNKNGAIFKQGRKFNQLAPLMKRQYRVAFIEELFIAVSGSQASKDELTSMLNVLERGGSREGVYRSIVLSGTYSNLESYQEQPKDALLDFTARLAGKYLNKSFNKDVMAQLNLYGIKKLMTEKMLEVMDAFPTDGKDLRSWYAVLSSDLAKEFSGLWKGKIRGITQREPHFKWAGSVPFQHIKSEVIIKIHKVMNKLQD